VTPYVNGRAKICQVGCWHPRPMGRQVGTGGLGGKEQQEWRSTSGERFKRWLIPRGGINHGGIFTARGPRRGLVKGTKLVWVGGLREAGNLEIREEKKFERCGTQEQSHLLGVGTYCAGGGGQERAFATGDAQTLLEKRTLYTQE